MLLLALAVGAAAELSQGDLKHLERSFWVHASLASAPQLGYYGTNRLSSRVPLETEIRHAARVFTEDYGANRLYLIYHKEISIADAERVFEIWREVCPAETDLVPALLLRAYDEAESQVFSRVELRQLSGFFKTEVNPARIAVLDLKAHRSQGSGLKILAEEYNGGLIRLGLQPDEQLEAPFTAGVEDTWAAFSQGTSNEDWQKRGSGLETLRNLVQARNNHQSLPVAWNLIVVAGDYSAAATDGHPQTANVEKNAPLPSGRSSIGALAILRQAQGRSCSGFSCDLHRMQTSSQTLTHDGSGYSFYEMLKRGQVYVGYYARPFYEVVKIYDSLHAGNLPEPLAGHQLESK